MTDFAMPIMERDDRDRRVAPNPIFTWPTTEDQRNRAKSNHGQTLERLRERGGVCWTELYCILRGVELFSIKHDADNQRKAKAWALNAYPNALS